MKLKKCYGRSPGDIKAVRPMKDGVIADFTATQLMLKNIMKNIQIHLNTEDAYEVNSRYMYAYSTIFDCSYDYLYGRSEIMTADLDVRDICNKTGLSEKAVVNLVERHQDEIESSGFSVIEWWSELLYDIPFTAIPMAFMAYASRLVELHDCLLYTSPSPRDTR